MRNNSENVQKLGQKGHNLGLMAHLKCQNFAYISGMAAATGFIFGEHNDYTGTNQSINQSELPK